MNLGEAMRAPPTLRLTSYGRSLACQPGYVGDVHAAVTLHKKNKQVWRARILRLLGLHPFGAFTY